MKYIASVGLIITLLSLSVNAGWLDWSFNGCFSSVQTCFFGHNSYSSESGSDEVSSCSGYSSCTSFFSCIKVKQFIKGAICIPFMGPVCAWTLINVVGNAYLCYLDLISRKYPGCNLRPTEHAQKTVSCAREVCRLRYGGGPKLRDDCEEEEKIVEVYPSDRPLVIKKDGFPHSLGGIPESAIIESGVDPEKLVVSKYGRPHRVVVDEEEDDPRPVVIRRRPQVAYGDDPEVVRLPSHRREFTYRKGRASGLSKHKQKQVVSYDDLMEILLSSAKNLEKYEMDEGVEDDDLESK